MIRVTRTGHADGEGEDGGMSGGGRAVWRISAAVGLLLTAIGSPAGAEGFGTFTALAAADGGRVVWTVPAAAAVDTIIDGGAPAAQALVNGLGTSTGYAAAPYPGEAALSGPGTGATMLGLPSPPAYPLIAATSYPVTNDAKVEGPGFRLTSRSEAAASSASAEMGSSADPGAVAHGRATATVSTGADRMTAEAESVNEGLVIGGVLRIGAVRSTARMIRLAGGEVHRQSSLVVDGVVVGDTPVGFDERGLVLPGTVTPVPGDGPVADVLRRAGVSVQRLRAQETGTGVIAAGVRVTQRQALPDGHHSFLTLTLGQARAELTAEMVSLPQLSGDVGPGPLDGEPGSPAVEPPGAGAAPMGSPPSGTSPVEGSPVPPVEPVSTVESTGAGSETAASGVAGPAGASPRAAGVFAARPSLPDPMVSGAGLYLVLAFCGVAATAGFQLVRVRGERG